MKNINRMALGTITSLLLSAGLTKAAEKFDPISKSIGNSNFGPVSNEASANSCIVPCQYLTE